MGGGRRSAMGEIQSRWKPSTQNKKQRRVTADGGERKRAHQTGFLSFGKTKQGENEWRTGDGRECLHSYLPIELHVHQGGSVT